MKQIISLLISLTLLLSVVPAAVTAEETLTAAITIEYIDEEKNTIKDSVVFSESYEEGSAYTLPASYMQDFAVKTADGKYNHYVFNEGTSQIPEYYSQEMTVTLVFNNDMQYDFYEDFENYTINTSKWHEQTSSVPEPTIEEDHTKYINHKTGSSTTGGYMTFDEIDTTGKTVHISADVKFTEPSGSKKGNSQITICNTSPGFSGNNITWGIIESSPGHIITLEYNGGTTFKVNGVTADTAFIGGWVHMEADVDFGSRAVSVTLTNEAGKSATYESTIFSKTLDMNIGAFYMRSAGETASTSIDNLAIQITGEAGEFVPDIESVLNFKSVYAFGDSIVYGHNSPSTSFMRLIANDYAMDLNMMAKNGATIMQSSNRVLTQIKNAPAAAPDFVVFEGYTNDAYGSADTDSFNSSGASRDVTQCYGEITPEGTTSFDNSTFCGAFEETIYAIKQKWPESNVVFVTIHQSGGRDFEIQTKLRDLSIEMCEKWGVEVVDMYSYVNADGKTLDTRNADEMAKYIINGAGSHPNEKCCREFYIPAVVEVLEGILNGDEPTPTPTVEPTAIPEKVTKIIADYSEDGRLIGVSAVEIYDSEISDVENTNTHKVFYWNSLDGMTPVAAATAIPTTEPTAEPTQNPENIESTEVYVFGTDTAAEGEIPVSADTAFGAQGYGLVNIDEASAPDDFLFDGWYNDVYTYPESKVTNGITSIVASYDEYDEETLEAFAYGQVPVRFAAAAQQGEYYTVTATIVNTGDTASSATLFTEVRDAILNEYTLAPGESITKSWNINLWGQYHSTLNGQYADNAINVSVVGKNIGLARVKIEKHKSAGKTMWLCTDSTGNNITINLPYFPLGSRGGVGQYLTKYLNPEYAINNQGEGGINFNDKYHLNNFKDQMKPGDYLYVEYGFNGDNVSTITSNLPRYYEAAQAAGATLIVASSTERQNSQFWKDGAWVISNGTNAAACKSYVDGVLAANPNATDIAFVDLNTAINAWMNSETQRIFERRKALGFDDTAVSSSAIAYYYAFDRTSGSDNIHMNNAGADNGAYIVFTEMQKTVAAGGNQAQALAPLVENASQYTPYIISDDIIKEGWAMNSCYPMPLPGSIEYDYPTQVQGVAMNDDAIDYITVQVLDNSMAYYARGAVDILDADENVKETIYSTSTDKNSDSDHIDNVSAQNGDVFKMYFDAKTLGEGESIRAYTVAQPNGEEPTHERYSNYHVADSKDAILLSADYGSVVSDGAHTYNNSKNLSGSVSNGIVKAHFVIDYSYGTFSVKLGHGGARTFVINDGIVKFAEDSDVSKCSEIAKIRKGMPTDIYCTLNLIDGELTVEVAGFEPKTISITELQSENESDAANHIPVSAFSFSSISAGSTLNNYPFDAKVTSAEVYTVKTELPKYTIAAEVHGDCVGMGTVEGNGTYDINTAVSIKAKPASGYKFSGWYDSKGNKVSGNSEYTVRIRSYKALYAKFEIKTVTPNVTEWDFGGYSGENAINATSAQTVTYAQAEGETGIESCIEIHLASGDTITEEGLYWTAAATRGETDTAADRNRYIVFTPSKSGTLKINFMGSLFEDKRKPRLYIVEGTSEADAYKSNVAAQKAEQSAANSVTTLTAELEAGKTYYIWTYYYFNTYACPFTIYDITYDTN